jgi:hypothetical protein
MNFFPPSVFSALSAVPLVLGLVFAIAFSARVNATVVAGPVMNPDNGHAYYLLAENTWPESEAEAVRLGGHLVTINDAAENTWIVNTFCGPNPGFHIGLTDQGEEGVWVWTSGDPVTYTNWNAGEPNNGHPDGWAAYPYENFAAMYGESSGSPVGTWNDIMGTEPDQILLGLVEISQEKLYIRTSQVELCWPSENGLVYQVQFCSTPAGEWANFGSSIVGTGAQICLTDSVPASGSRYYRLIRITGTPPN